MKNTKRIFCFIAILSLLLAVFALGCSASASGVISADGYTESDIYDNGQMPSDEYYPEEGIGYDPLFTPTGAVVFLIVISILVGIVLPMVPFVIYLVRILKRSEGVDFADYTICASSLLWIASGVILLIMFI